MEQLTLEQAANDYMPLATSEEDNRYIRSHHKSFKAGAKWQKEQYKKLLFEAQNAISVFIGNTPSGGYRNHLTDLNIKLLELLQD